MQRCDSSADEYPGRIEPKDNSGRNNPSCVFLGVKMAEKQDDELDWDKLKAGRLDEGKSEAALLSGRGARTPPMVLRRTVFFVPRKVAMTREAPGLNFRTGPNTELAGRTTTAPFHIAHSFVSRARSRSTPRIVGKGSRVAVFPRKAEVADWRAQGGRYHSRHHVWTLPANSPFLKTKKGAVIRSIKQGQTPSSI